MVFVTRHVGRLKPYCTILYTYQVLLESKFIGIILHEAAYTDEIGRREKLFIFLRVVKHATLEFDGA